MGPLLQDEGLPATRAHLKAFIACQVESPEVADDLTQDVLVRLLTHDDGRVENPTAWLYRVARNVIIDHYRSRGSHRQDRLDADDLALAGAAEDPFADDLALAGAAEDPFADDPQAAQRELAGCLRPLVDQLAEPYRSAVSAVDLGGRTHTDVAQAVGLSTSGMKSRVQRGRRQLRQLLTDCCRVHASPTGSISGYEPVTGCHPTPSGDNSCR
jgi:RNA polymerase sigma-70 factor (ECF subfamily)